MNQRDDQPIVTVIFTVLAWVLAWLTIKLWRYLRARSPGWAGPTLYCVLLWVAIISGLRKLLGN